MLDYLNATVLVLALLVAAATDLRLRVIPNEVVLLIIILAMHEKLFVSSTEFDTAFLRALIVFSVLIIPYLFDVMGGGDIKLIAALAFYNSEAQLLDFAWYTCLGYIGTLIILKIWWCKSPPHGKYRGMPLAVPIFFGQVTTLVVT